MWTVISPGVLVVLEVEEVEVVHAVSMSVIGPQLCPKALAIRICIFSSPRARRPGRSTSACRGAAVVEGVVVGVLHKSRPTRSTAAQKSSRPRNGAIIARGSFPKSNCEVSCHERECRAKTHGHARSLSSARAIRLSSITRSDCTACNPCSLKGQLSSPCPLDVPFA